jgi:hypothetical protein
VSTPDPYAEIRNKRMSELTPEQADLAMEKWLRENYLSFGQHYGYRRDALFPSVLRHIDSLRERLRRYENAPPVAYSITYYGEHVGNIFNVRAAADDKMKELDSINPEGERQIVPLIEKPQ